MDSFILDDVNELIELKKGDSSRLIRIKEICESNGIISLSDRKYIERLSSQYLQKYEQQKPKKPDRPKFEPIDEQSNSIAKTENLVSNQIPQVERPTPKEEVYSRKTYNVNSILNLNKSKKIIFSIASIVLAIILIGVVAVGYNGIEFESNSGVIDNDNLPDFSLETDRTSYETSDIISISGKMTTSSKGTVRLFIENEKMELIWAENLSLKNNGEFSTLLIAGGKGWEKDGKYFLNVEFDDYSSSVTFDFNAR